MSHRTLLDGLSIARKNLNKGITFINGADDEEFLSYQDVYDQMLLRLGYLQAKGLQPKDEVVFQLEDNKDFLLSFWACVAGGFIPVPLAVAHHQEGIAKLTKIWGILNRPTLLTSRSNFEKLQKNGDGQLITEAVSVFVEDSASAIIPGKVHHAIPGDIAFIQFSSGSTGDPKGVTLTHANLISNIEGTIEAAQLERSQNVLSWMPLTHDMGLIGFHLNPVFLCSHLFIMPTELFVRHPLLWIKKLSEHKIAITSSPNFGYQHCMSRFSEDKLEGIDLSSVRMIFNGAEPISAQVCREFLNAFSRYGLKEEAMFTVYGLAEASLAVTFPPPYQAISTLRVSRKSLGPQKRMEPASDDAVEMVNCGKVIPYCQIRISDESGHAVDDGVVGYVHIRGENVTSCYYNNPEATAKAIDHEGWLNTGDLGFIYEGDTFITGRMKEIIYVAGQNIYPHDIERRAEVLEEIEPGKVVACGVPNSSTGLEDVVLFVLFKRKPAYFLPLVKKLKRHIAAAIGVEVAHVVPVRKIPKTTSGKIKRVELADEYQSGAYNEVVLEIDHLLKAESMGQPESEHHSRLSYEAIHHWVQQWLSKRLNIPFFEIESQKTFAELGVTSLIAVEFARAIELKFNFCVDPTVAWNFPNIQSLATYLYDHGKGIKTEVPAAVPSSSAQMGDDIAVVGMGCRFPGADNLAAYWKLLEEGKSGVSEVTDDRWNRHYLSAHVAKTITYGGYLDHIDAFDASFFGIAPVEALQMDPQQRLVLEITWHALEHAGISQEKISGSETGVFLGVSSNDYSSLQVNNISALNAYSGTGNASSIMANRLSYQLNLTGPSMAVDTACSSSLVAVHLACQSLKLGECDMALAGGVNLIINPALNVIFSQAHMLAEDGQCKTFDGSANGYVRGEGCGIVVLKRLEDALRDNDRIHAVVRGSAINQDGKSNGLTAPNGRSQKRVIEKALQQAKISSSDVSYVEAHGTGTPLGDPIELHALADVIGTSRQEKCWVGSVKTNIGHLEAAAGIAGLIKTALSLKNQKIPGILNYKQLNPHINLRSAQALTIPQQLVPWTTSGKRIAGVSSFGFGGTNAHVLLEEHAPLDKVPSAALTHYPVIISAKSAHALDRLLQEYRTRLSAKDISLADLSYSTTCRRSQLAYSKIIIAGNMEEVSGALKVSSHDVIKKTSPAPLSFVFTSGKVKEVHLKQLVNDFDGLDELNSSFQKFLKETGKEKIDEKYPAVVQLLFAMAHAKVYRMANITPQAILGIGVTGRLAAACFSGAIDLETALKLAKASDENAIISWEAGFRTGNSEIPLKSEASGEVKDVVAYLKVAFEHNDPDIVNSQVSDEGILEIGARSAESAHQRSGINPQSDVMPQLLGRLAGLLKNGYPVAWDFLFKKHHASFLEDLPLYPFERTRFWLDNRESSLEWLPLPNAKTVGVTDDVMLREHSYVVDWKKTATLPKASFADKRHWVLMADQQGWGDELLRQLQQADQEVSIIYPDKHPDHIRQSLQAISRHIDPALTCTCIYLWGLEQINCQSSDLACYFRLIETARVVREHFERASLWVITTNTQPVGELDFNGLIQSPLWGMGKTVALETKEIWGGLIDLGQHDAETAASLIFSEVANQSPDDLVAWRGEQRYVFRLKRAAFDYRKSQGLDPEGTYMITGGLGYLGLQLTRMLVEHGAQKIVLTSRSGLPLRESWGDLPPHDNRRNIIDSLEELEARGASIMVLKMDVSDKADIKDTIEKVQQVGTLRGIFHLAGVSEYHTIDAMEYDQFAKTMTPKVAGSWYLHELTQSIDLQYFVCFSSATAVWGGKAQAHYAAANEFMDHLAHYRSSVGLPALTINLGPVKGGGMATENKEMFEKIGISELEPGILMQNIFKLMQSNAIQAILVDVNWSKFKDIYEYHVKRPLSEDITWNEDAGKVMETSAFLKELEQLPLYEREEALANHVSALVGAVLGYTTPPPKDQGLFDLGMDSISALDLKEKLEHDLQVKLNQTIVFDYPTVGDMIGYFRQELLTKYFSNTEPLQATEVLPEVASPALDELDQMTEDELESILSEQLKRIL